MKYAILGPRQAINRVVERDTAPTAPHVELTDAQAETISPLLADKRQPVWVDGEPLSRLDIIASGDRLRFDEQTQTLVRFTPTPPPVPVPPEVPLWAFRQVLIEDNLLAAVQTAVADSAVLTNFLEYGNFVDRSSPALAALATGLGKTSDEVDAMFRRAGALKL